MSFHTTDDDATFELEDVEVIHETQEALLITSSDLGQTWIPISQVSALSEVYAKGHKGSLLVTEWFAAQRGWI